MSPLQKIQGQFDPTDLMTHLPDVEWNTVGIADRRQHTYTFAMMVIRGDVRVRTVNGFGPMIHGGELCSHHSKSLLGDRGQILNAFA